MKLEILALNDTLEKQNFIIDKIRDIINIKNLESGDRLPSERMLAEKFHISRKDLREAINKLEFYGILKPMPQSGTFITDIGTIAINGMIDDIIRIKDSDFKSLVETRLILELKAVKLAALRRTEADLLHIKNTLDNYNKKVLAGKNAVQEDLLFHLSIAKASGNSTLNTFMLTITPQIIINFDKYHVCDKQKSLLGIQEHTDIYEAIKNQKPTLAKEKMKTHFSVLYQYCYHTPD